MHKVLNGSSLSSLLISVIVGVACLVGCRSIGSGDELRHVVVDLDNVKEFRIDADDIKSVNIGITDIAVDALFQKEKIFIRFRNSVTAYDLNTGDSLYSFSRRGRRDDEFVSLVNFWMLGEEALELYDFNSRKILRFNPETGDLINVLTSKDLGRGNPFVALRWDSKNSRFIGLKSFTEKPVPDLAVYDGSHQFVEDINAPIKRSGTSSSYSVIPSESERMLYHQPYRNTVYLINGNEIYPEYIINLGSRSIPEPIIDENEGHLYSYWTENKDTYALFTGFMAESQKALYFSFLYSDKGYLARYDRKKDVTTVYQIVPRSGTLAFHDGVLYVITHEETGTKVFSIPEKMFE